MSDTATKVQNTINVAERSFRYRLEECKTLNEISDLQNDFLKNDGELTTLRRKIGLCRIDERGALGVAVDLLKDAIEKACARAMSKFATNA